MNIRVSIGKKDEEQDNQVRLGFELMESKDGTAVGRLVIISSKTKEVVWGTSQRNLIVGDIITFANLTIDLSFEGDISIGTKLNSEN